MDPTPVADMTKGSRPVETETDTRPLRVERTSYPGVYRLYGRSQVLAAVEHMHLQQLADQLAELGIIARGCARVPF